MNRKLPVIFAGLLVGQVACVIATTNPLLCRLQGFTPITETKPDGTVVRDCLMVAPTREGTVPEPGPAEGANPPEPVDAPEAAGQPTDTTAPAQAAPLDCGATASLQVEAILDYDDEISSGRHCLYRLRVTNPTSQALVYFWHLYADNDAHTYSPEWETNPLAPGETVEREYDAFYWTNGKWSYYLADKVAAIVDTGACREQVNPEAGLAALEALAQDTPYYCGP